jgi:hypothetical protein
MPGSHASRKRSRPSIGRIDRTLAPDRGGKKERAVAINGSVIVSAEHCPPALTRVNPAAHDLRQHSVK